MEALRFMDGWGLAINDGSAEEGNDFGEGEVFEGSGGVHGESGSELSCG